MMFGKNTSQGREVTSKSDVLLNKHIGSEIVTLYWNGVNGTSAFDG
jgi:hypothetical protein